MRINRRHFIRFLITAIATIGFAPKSLLRKANADDFSEVTFGSLNIGDKFKVINVVKKKVSDGTPVMTKVAPVACDPDPYGPNPCSRATFINVNYVGNYLGENRTAFFLDSMKVVPWN